MKFKMTSVIRWTNNKKRDVLLDESLDGSRCGLFLKAKDSPRYIAFYSIGLIMPMIYAYVKIRKKSDKPVPINLTVVINNGPKEIGSLIMDNHGTINDK